MKVLVTSILVLICLASYAQSDNGYLLPKLNFEQRGLQDRYGTKSYKKPVEYFEKNALIVKNSHLLDAEFFVYYLGLLDEINIYCNQEIAKGINLFTSNPTRTKDILSQDILKRYLTVLLATEEKMLEDIKVTIYDFTLDFMLKTICVEHKKSNCFF